MLDALRPGVLEEWIAYDRIEPFGDEQLTRLLLYALAAMGSDADWQTLRRRPPAEEAAEESDAANAAAVMRALTGLRVEG
jgi:hypothetical protein